jgi:hypothetical protein
MNSETMQADSVYKGNLNALKKLTPSICRKLESRLDDGNISRSIDSVKGAPTIEVSTGKTRLLLHSKKDPLGEARRFVQSNIDGNEQMITVVGFGLGYHIEELLRTTKAPVILIIEPSLSILNTALKTRDLSIILNSGRIMITQDPEFTKHDFSDMVPPHTSINLLVLRPYLHLFPEEVKKARDTFFSFLNRRQINTATLKRFDRLWTKNTFKNISFFFSLHGINELNNILKGIPAIVICAGPSLDADLDLLPACKKNSFIIAVDTTVKPLLKRGIIPDFAVTVDPQFINSFFLSSVSSGSIQETDLPVLIADPAVYPSTLRNYKGSRVLTSSVFSPGKIIEQFAGEKGNIAAGGSVSVAAFDLARITGADPIILLGLDLSYSGGKTHFSGSFMETYILSRINRFKGAQSYYTKYIKEGSPALISDKNGKIVYSDKRLLLYRSWFENQAPGTASRIINAAAGGINIEGIENIPLKELRLTDLNNLISRNELEKRIHDILKVSTIDTDRVTKINDYMDGVEGNLKELKALSIKASGLSRALISSSKNDPDSKIREELDNIDKRILSFKDESQLVSMVLQSSINEILNMPVALKEKDVIDNSLKLYMSIEDGSGLLLDLIKYSKKKLNKLAPGTDFKNRNIL